MAIVAEDGTGKANSVSYVTVSDADTYFTAEGNEDWSDLSTAEKEKLLVSATRSIERDYATKFIGVRTTLAQALSWPRLASDANGFDISASVPRELKIATYELALSYARGEKIRASGNVSGGAIKSTKTQVGPIVTETEYASPSIQLTARDDITHILASVIYPISFVRLFR